MEETQRGQFQGKPLYPLPEQKPTGRKPPEPIPDKEKKPSYNNSPPSPFSGLSGEFGKLFGKLGSLSLETEDLLLIAVLYLMYRESGDKELLIMIGALLFL